MTSNTPSVEVVDAARADDLARERAVHGVVAEEVGERAGVGDVVHRDELERRLVQAGAEDVAPDAAEAVDADPECHRGAYPKSVRERQGDRAAVPSVDAPRAVQ